jgi:hypothetical protein
MTRHFLAPRGKINNENGRIAPLFSIQPLERQKHYNKNYFFPIQIAFICGKMNQKRKTAAL